MSRAERKRTAKKSENGAKFLTALACIFVLASGIFLIWSMYFVERDKAIDKITLCPLQGAPETINVILIDISDPLPETSKIEANLLLSEIAEAIPMHGLLDIRQLTSNSPYQKMLFAKCSPARGRNQTYSTGNPELAEKKWRESFFEPAKKAIEQSLSPSRADNSPIMAAIQRIAIERFLPNSSESAQKRFIIVSDLFESTSLYSQYNKMFDFENFTKLPAFKTYQTDLHGASVDVFYVQRRFDYSERGHVSFWEQWFEANHGRIESIKKLQGAGK